MRSSSKGRGVSSGREENPSGAGRSPRRQLWRKDRFFEFFSARLSLSLSLFLSAPDSLKFSSSGEPGQCESSWQVSASLPYVLSVGSGHDHVPPGIQKVEGVERRDRHGCASFLSGVGVILSPAAPAAELPWSPRTLPSPLPSRGLANAPPEMLVWEKYRSFGGTRMSHCETKPVIHIANSTSEKGIREMNIAIRKDQLSSRPSPE